MLRLEHRDQVFVAEFVLLPVCLDVMPVFWRSLDVHHSRIPFATESRNRIRSPMNKNPELRVLVPLGHFVVLQRFPVRSIAPLAIRVFNVLQKLCSLPVILAACLLPDLIDSFWRFRRRWRRRALCVAPAVRA